MIPVLHRRIAEYFPKNVGEAAFAEAGGVSKLADRPVSIIIFNDIGLRLGEPVRHDGFRLNRGRNRQFREKFRHSQVEAQVKVRRIFFGYYGETVIHFFDVGARQVIENKTVFGDGTIKEICGRSGKVDERIFPTVGISREVVVIGIAVQQAEGLRFQIKDPICGVQDPGTGMGVDQLIVFPAGALCVMGGRGMPSVDTERI